MRVSDMIKNLQDFMDEHGDLECWYSEDDEGNRYQEVHYEPSKYYVDEGETVYTSLEDVKACDLDVTDVTPICIVN